LVGCWIGGQISHGVRQIRQWRARGAGGEGSATLEAARDPEVERAGFFCPRSPGDRVPQPGQPQPARTNASQVGSSRTISAAGRYPTTASAYGNVATKTQSQARPGPCVETAPRAAYTPAGINRITSSAKEASAMANGVTQEDILSWVRSLVWSGSTTGRR